MANSNPQIGSEKPAERRVTRATEPKAQMKLLRPKARLGDFMPGQESKLDLRRESQESGCWRAMRFGTRVAKAA